MDGSLWWPTRLLFLIMILNSFLPVQAFPISRNDTQPDQTAGASPAVSVQNEVSWQSAFWALVAIAFGAATQPSGRILGMPPGWGFALKLSPIFCIVNAAEALTYIRIRRCPWAVVVLPGKYEVAEAEPAASSPQARRGRYDMSTLQHNTTLRVILFILGPVLQAVNLFGCSGIAYTQAVAAAFLASFVCDEVVLTLLWATQGSAADSEDGRAVTHLIANVLQRLSASKSSDAPDATEQENPPPVAPPPLEQRARQTRQPAHPLAGFVFMVDMWFFFNLSTTLVIAAHMAEPKLFAWDYKIEQVVFHLAGVICAVKPKIWFKTFSGLIFVLRGGDWEVRRPPVEPSGKDIMNRILVFFHGLTVGFSMSALAMFLLRKLIEAGMDSIVRNPRGRLEPFNYLHEVWAPFVFLYGVPFMHGVMPAVVRFLDLWNTAHVVLPADWVLRRLSPAQPNSHRLWWSFPAAWCTFRFLVGLFTYYAFFGARETFQPGWTGVLG